MRRHKSWFYAALLPFRFFGLSHPPSLFSFLFCLPLFLVLFICGRLRVEHIKAHTTFRLTVGGLASRRLGGGREGKKKSPGKTGSGKMRVGTIGMQDYASAVYLVPVPTVLPRFIELLYRFHLFCLLIAVFALLTARLFCSLLSSHAAMSFFRRCSAVVASFIMRRHSSLQEGYRRCTKMQLGYPDLVL